jgi:hypothetical protein
MTQCTGFKPHARRTVRWLNHPDFSVADAEAVKAFLYANWDFVDESANGTEDIWRILEGQDYPRLWWEAE